MWVCAKMMMGLCEGVEAVCVCSIASLPLKASDGVIAYHAENVHR